MTNELIEPIEPTEPILTFAQLRDYGIKYTRNYIDRLERAGKFPRRVPIGTFRVGWLKREIIAHQRVHMALRSKRIGELGSATKLKGRFGKGE